MASINSLVLSLILTTSAQHRSEALLNLHFSRHDNIYCCHPLRAAKHAINVNLFQTMGISFANKTYNVGQWERKSRKQEKIEGNRNLIALRAGQIVVTSDIRVYCLLPG